MLNASIVSIKGMPGFGVYSATKAAVRSFARHLDQRTHRTARSVSTPSVLAPLILLEWTASHRIRNKPSRSKQVCVSQVPLGRMGEPDEIAKAVVFLASDDSSFVAGVELFVDGGMVQV